MIAGKAVDFFLGKNDLKRLNCAQAIYKVFIEKYNLDESKLHILKKYGKGNAPDGECGAVYAAKIILQNNNCKCLENVLNKFFELTETFNCNKIRKLRKINCIQSVEIIARLIEKLCD